MIDIPETPPRFRRERSRKSKCSTVIYVYFPVILLFFLIIMIYSTYFYKYIYVLLNGQNYSVKSFPLINTTNPFESKRKGIILLALTGSCVLLLFISLLRTILMDPGYFDDPTKFEMNIVMKNSSYTDHKLKQKARNMSRIKGEKLTSEHAPTLLDIESYEEKLRRKKRDFLKSFGKELNDGPLTFYEFSKYHKKLFEYIDEKPLDIGLSFERDTDFRLSKATKKALGVPELIMNQDYSFDSSKMMFNNTVIHDEDNKPLFKDDKIINKDPTSLDFVFEHYKHIEISKSNLCNSCLRWKFERSHHCRQCGKCVLKMDHHCPWLSNCIGFRNYKYFCLTHIYGTIGSLFITSTFWEVVFNNKVFDQSGLIEFSFYLFVYLANIGLMCFLFWLLNANAKLVFSGMTIIEQSDRERFPSTKSVNIYDLGWYRNFKTVFGENFLTWFLPFNGNYNGLGIVFETNEVSKTGKTK